MRLNRKRKPSDEREADKDRSKQICLERSAAKTLLTLHRRTGKSREEHEATGTLLDLSFESVVSLQEMEEQIVDQFPKPLPDDEPIDSHVDRRTQTGGSKTQVTGQVRLQVRSGCRSGQVTGQVRLQVRSIGGIFFCQGN